MRAAALAAVLAACAGQAPPIVVDLGAALDAGGEGEVSLRVDVDGAREVVVDVDRDVLVEVWAGGAAPAWTPPRPVDAGERLAITIEADGAVELIVWGRGAPLPAVRRERSLTWTDPALLDDPAVIGLGRLMATIAADGHGGVMLDTWFRRFASTAHSERAAPAQLMDEVAAAQGDDPSAWDLDLLPFTVTAVHQRIDLGPRNGGCGELRVSIASTHGLYSPFHAIFLFSIPPAGDDVTPDGAIHCAGTARRWQRLSALDGADWETAARAVLDDGLRADRFLLIETVERTITPWEWRQWAPAGVDVVDNPSLFQTIDLPALDQAGSRRDAFLDFIAANAAGLAARTVEIPAQFRAPSAQAPNVPEDRPRLDLTGLDPAVLDAYPELAGSIEIVGCPTCHTENAEFVQTSPQRTFSDFYDAELDARAERLALMNDGVVPEVPPFGPLQAR